MMRKYMAMMAVTFGVWGGSSVTAEPHAYELSFIKSHLMVANLHCKAEKKEIGMLFNNFIRSNSATLQGAYKKISSDQSNMDDFLTQQANDLSLEFSLSPKACGQMMDKYKEIQLAVSRKISPSYVDDVLQLLPVSMAE